MPMQKIANAKSRMAICVPDGPSNRWTFANSCQIHGATRNHLVRRVQHLELTSDVAYRAGPLRG